LTLDQKIFPLPAAFAGTKTTSVKADVFCETNRMFVIVASLPENILKIPYLSTDF